MEKNSDLRGYLFAFVAVFIWSFNVIVARYFANTLSPFEITWARWFFAGVVLLPFTYKSLWRQRHLLLSHWQLILGLSVTGIVMMNTLVYKAGHTATAVDMSLIGMLGPIILVILSRIFLKTRVSSTQIIGLTATVLGVMIIILHGNLADLNTFKFVQGDLWMLGTTFVFATYSLLQGMIRGQISPTTLLSATIIVGLAIVTPINFWHGNPYAKQSLDLLDWGILLYVGVFNSVFAFLLWNISLAHLGGVKAGSLYYLLPLFSTVEAYFLLGEKLYIDQIYGGVLVLVGIFFAGRHPKNVDEIYRP